MKKFIRKIYFLLYYNLFLKRKNAETAFERIGAFKFTVPPTVFNPVEYYSSEVFANFIETLDLSGKNILDMGCGSGIVSVFAASKGAKCFAIDINPMSAKAAAQNALVNGFSKNVEAIENDLFESLPSAFQKKYDFIFFNPPYFKGVPKNNFERSFKGGENYEVIKTFIKDSKEFLAPDGIIYFIVSTDMDLSQLEGMFRERGFEFIIKEKIEKLFETFYITKSFLIKAVETN
jgi:release factor glutamine methyltransferase